MFVVLALTTLSDHYIHRLTRGAVQKLSIIRKILPYICKLENNQFEN